MYSVSKNFDHLPLNYNFECDFNLHLVSVILMPSEFFNYDTIESIISFYISITSFIMKYERIVLVIDSDINHEVVSYFINNKIHILRHKMKVNDLTKAIYLKENESQKLLSICKQNSLMDKINQDLMIDRYYMNNINQINLTTNNNGISIVSTNENNTNNELFSLLKGKNFYINSGNDLMYKFIQSNKLIFTNRKVLGTNKSNETISKLFKFDTKESILELDTSLESNLNNLYVGEKFYISDYDNKEVNKIDKFTNKKLESKNINLNLLKKANINLNDIVFSIPYSNRYPIFPNDIDN